MLTLRVLLLFCHRSWWADTNDAMRACGWDGSWCGNNNGRDAMGRSQHAQHFARLAKLDLLFVERCIGSTSSWSAEEAASIKDLVPEFGESWSRYFGASTPAVDLAVQSTRAAMCALAMRREPGVHLLYSMPGRAINVHPPYRGSTTASTAVFLHGQCTHVIVPHTCEPYTPGVRSPRLERGRFPSL